MNLTKEKIQEAEEQFGKDIVEEVINCVEISDPDGVYSMFEDLGYFDHSECVEFLYFE